MIKRILLPVMFSFSYFLASSNEGMWPISELKAGLIDSMRYAGLNIHADEIYNNSGNSIKDAIVIFGGGCTGELVSNNGLIFTNHHCAYDAIQKLSTVENDYLMQGFSAKSQNEELPCKGLSVRFLHRSLDITDSVAPFLCDSFSESNRQKIIDSIAQKITAGLPEYNQSQFETVTKEFYAGNQIYLVTYKIYNDIRLVACPPSSIGKFGGDTDNWMWPRHTGDFAVLRAYSDSSGLPAAYSEKNIPLKPTKYLKISTKGIAENDFSMVIGFPGSTKRNLTSAEIIETTDVINAIRIKTRGIRQEILLQQMNKNPEVRIKYAAKYARSSNYWKYSIGQNKGVKNLKLINKKAKEEETFNQWAITVDSAKYYGINYEINKLITDRVEAAKAVNLYNEAFIRGIEIISLARQFNQLLYELGKTNPDTQKLNSSIKELKAASTEFYSNYDVATEKAIAVAMLHLLATDLAVNDQFKTLLQTDTRNMARISKFVEKIYAKSIFGDSVKLNLFLKKPSKRKLETDPIFTLANEGMRKYYQVYQNYSPDTKLKTLQRKYTEGQMQMKLQKGIIFYPDANFTMRLSYGKIKSYKPADAVTYNYYTTTNGILEKYEPGSHEFDVPEKLLELITNTNFGNYSVNNEMPVAFISDNDITGGNSGSPVLNKNGELIGIAFDGNWEAMSGDLVFDPNLKRTISVDIRYVLFILDKYCKAEYLLNEMEIVN